MTRQIVVMSKDQADKDSPERIAAQKQLDQLEYAYHQVGSSMSVVSQLMLDFEDRNLWRVIGYASMYACLRSRLGLGKSQVYRLIAAAKIHRNLLTADESPRGENVAVAAGKHPISEKILRPLADSSLGVKDQRRAYKQAEKFSARDCKHDEPVLRPKHVKEAIAEIVGKPSVPNPLSKKERIRKLREYILKAIGLADLLAVDSSVRDFLSKAQEALDK